MVSNQSPSTSTAFHVEEGIGGAELDRLMRDDFIQLCVLDCRSEGPMVKTANRIRLPNVLFRRLQNGSLALSNISPRLSEEGVKVIIIPGTGCESATSLALTNALRKEGYQFRVLFDPVDAVISSYPNLRSEDDRMCSHTSASDVGCLNLKWSLEDAYDLVLRRNASIAPNFHFMGQLTDYERHLGLKSASLGVSSIMPFFIEFPTNSNLSQTYPSMGPRSPFCAVEAAVGSGLLTPPPTSCSASPQSSIHSAKSFD
uniref:Rhodanese domain-containing protein n=1 Tax=Heterorhabditis bacteriophora TaxID=37862 RepID=A0A1I7WMW8_HETBA